MKVFEQLIKIMQDLFAVRSKKDILENIVPQVPTKVKDKDHQYVRTRLIYIPGPFLIYYPLKLKLFKMLMILQYNLKKKTYDQ